MKYAFAIAAIAGLAAANAHAGHDRFHRRAPDAEVVTVTDWTVVTVTDVVTVVGPSPSAKPSSHAEKPSSAAPVVSSQPAAPSSEVHTPVVQSTPAAPSNPAAQTSAAPVTPTPQQQQTTLQTVTSQAPKVQSTSSAPAAAPTTPATGGSSQSNFGTLPGATVPANCPKEKPCTGDMTYYTAGLGACGHTDGDDSDAVAIKYDMFGTDSNGAVTNKLCGKKIMIKNPANGKTATGTIRDKCPGCSGPQGIDLSKSLMITLHGVADDRIPVEWYFL